MKYRSTRCEKIKTWAKNQSRAAQPSEGVFIVWDQGGFICWSVEDSNALLICEGLLYCFLCNSRDCESLKVRGRRLEIRCPWDATRPPYFRGIRCSGGCGMLLGLFKVNDVKSSALPHFNHVLQENVESERGGHQALVRALAFTEQRGHNLHIVRFDSSTPKWPYSTMSWDHRYTLCFQSRVNISWNLIVVFKSEQKLLVSLWEYRELYTLKEDDFLGQCVQKSLEPIQCVKIPSPSSQGWHCYINYYGYSNRPAGGGSTSSLSRTQCHYTNNIVGKAVHPGKPNAYNNELVKYNFTAQFFSCTFINFTKYVVAQVKHAMNMYNGRKIVKKYIYIAHPILHLECLTAGRQVGSSFL